MWLYLAMSAMLAMNAGCSSDDDCCSEDTPQGSGAEVIAPADGSVFTTNDAIVAFVGSVSDADGSEQYRWVSSMDGELGTGSELEVSTAALSTGVHQITMEVYRGDVMIGAGDIVITVSGETVDSPPETFIRSAPPESFSGNHFVRFSWEGVDPAGGSLFFRYQLEGPITTNGWINTEALENEPVCINVSGEYTFTVLAVNEQTGLSDPTPAVYRFEADACST